MYSQSGTKIMTVMILIVVSLTANAQTPNSILGKWKDADHPDKQIEIKDYNGKYIGKSVNTTQPNENGRIVFTDLIWSESSKSYTGILINPDNGDEFKIEIKIVGTDRFKFTVGKFIFSRTFTFKRIIQ